jgi:hypothetical protein
MNLTETQRREVATWISEGLKLSEIQNRIAAEFKFQMTYMEVRLLVADLKVTPRDPEVSKPMRKEALEGNNIGESSQPSANLPDPTSPQVSVTVDHLARAGSIVSGKVIFSDGIQADWYLDQMGRLGLSSSKEGYRPNKRDLEQFQKTLETELSRMGM